MKNEAIKFIEQYIRCRRWSHRIRNEKRRLWTRDYICGDNHGLSRQYSANGTDKVRRFSNNAPYNEALFRVHFSPGRHDDRNYLPLNHRWSQLESLKWILELFHSHCLEQSEHNQIRYANNIHPHEKLWSSYSQLFRHLSATVQTWESYYCQRPLLETRETISIELQSTERFSNPTLGLSHCNHLRRVDLHGYSHITVCALPDIADWICDDVLQRLCLVSLAEYVHLSQARV